MKSYTKLFFAFIFLAISAVGSAQDFSVAELIDLSAKDNRSVDNIVATKGYVYSGVVASDLSTNRVFDYGQEAKLYLIEPKFETDTRLLGWEFYSSATYDLVKNDILANNYRLVNVESRKKGSYVSHYYSKQGTDIILTLDKTAPTRDVYYLSVRSVDINKYDNSLAVEHSDVEDYSNSSTTAGRPKTPDNPNFKEDTKKYLERSKYLNK